MENNVDLPPVSDPGRTFLHTRYVRIFYNLTYLYVSENIITVTLKLSVQQRTLSVLLQTLPVHHLFITSCSFNL